MFTFLMQLADTFRYGRWHYFVLFFLFVNLVWLTKFVVSRFYRGYTEPFDVTAAVVIPVVDEEPDDFRRVLRSIIANRPDEIVVVINGARNPLLEFVCSSEGVYWTHTAATGKRNATVQGTAVTTSEILVLVDSDTVWDVDTLAELKKPFRDPRVGGVTTNQRIFGRERNVLSRCADWMEDIRATYSLPAMSVLGQVGCLPGRTIALRRDIVADNADRFLTERFLGIHLEISDDRTLTNYALQAGYRTVFQRTSRVCTDTPTELGRYVRQQYRWARGSQYNTLRMSGFMLRHTPFLAYCFFTDILIPFAWFGTLANLAWKIGVGDPVNYTTIPPWGQAALVVVGVMCSYALRNLPHLRRHPGDLAYLPVFVVFLAGISLIRLYGFFRCGEEAAWGTRKHAHAGTGQVSPLGIVPMYLGVAGVVVAAAIGPMLETRTTFTSEVDQHAVVLAVVASALLAALVTMTAERYLRMRRNATRQPVGAEAADVAASPAHRSSSSEHSRD